MQLRGHGNGIAIALAGLAVVLASTGTAYAVAASKVNIADPTTPSRIAHVDGSGHLLTASSSTLSTIDSAGYLLGYNQDQYTAITSPTTTSLAITRIRLSNPSLNTGVSEQIALLKVGVDASGNCLANPSGVLLGSYDLAAGQQVVDPLAQPLIVKATAGAKYCLSLYTSVVAGSVSYYTSYSVTAYAAGGTYTGVGASATPAVAQGSAKISS